MDSVKYKVNLRNAEKEDSEFVAECVLAAMGMYDFTERSEEFGAVLALCSAYDTLYSYRNAIIATAGGVSIGCLVCYPGDGYASARKRTFSMIAFPDGGLNSSDMETGPGEYYLDSLALVPAFRGQGIGKILLRAGIERGKASGFGRISLIVDKTHPRVREYYSSLGFESEKEIRFLGEDYIKMILVL